MHEYKGTKLTVRYDSHVCTHAGKCVANLPSVFNVSAQPWVQPDSAEADEVKRVVAMCPSGALTCEETS